METLPGIAAVLRSPVADAIVGVIRAAARMGDFDLTHADEIAKFAVRRNLMTQEETDRLLAEVREALERREERERGRKAASEARAKEKAKAKGKTTGASRGQQSAKAASAKKVAKASSKPVKRRAK